MLTASWTEHTVVKAGGVVYIAPESEEARIWFFTRDGGVSEPPYDSLNISTLVGDDEDAVIENRSRMATAMEHRPSAWVRQVAGDGIARVGEPGFAGEADALVTEGKGLALAVAVADCAPVALVGEGVVGMVHSGWRGTLAGISGKAARMMIPSPGGEFDMLVRSGVGSRESGVEKARIPAPRRTKQRSTGLGMSGGVRAYIGPCIRRCCYEVSEELAEEFARRFGPEVVSGRYLSVPDAIGKNLEEAGVRRVYDLGLCTGCRTDLFFSHRKQGPKTGRALAAVALL